MLETPGILDYGQFYLNYHYCHAHMHPFLFGIINKYLQQTKQWLSPPKIHSCAQTKDKKERGTSSKNEMRKNE
jgi:hypothetical protein